MDYLIGRHLEPKSEVRLMHEAFRRATEDAARQFAAVHDRALMDCFSPAHTHDFWFGRFTCHNSTCPSAPKGPQLAPARTLRIPLMLGQAIEYNRNPPMNPPVPSCCSTSVLRSPYVRDCVTNWLAPGFGA